MSVNLKIAIRFITSRKRSMMMSLAGIIFGVGFFIITQAQTSGFENFFIYTIIGTDSPIRIEDRHQCVQRSMLVEDSYGKSTYIKSETSKRYITGIEYPNKLRQALEPFEQIVVISEVVKGTVSVLSNFSNGVAQVNGIRLNDHLKVTNLSHQITFGSLIDFQSNSRSILIGGRLSKIINAQIGDYVILQSGSNKRLYPVVAIFETGIGDIDKQRIFMHLNESRSLLNKPFGESIFQIQVKSIHDARKIAKHIESALLYKAVSWQEREVTWLEVFRALRISSAITVSSIILISGLGMFNTLTMLVLDKTKEIAILRSMGFTRRDISLIFLMQGGFIFLIGTALGWIFGASSTYIISKLPIRIRGIFSTDHFIVNWSIYHYIWSAVIALFVVIIASYIPAKRASHLEPGNVIRGTSG